MDAAKFLAEGILLGAIASTASPLALYHILGYGSYTAYSISNTGTFDIHHTPLVDGLVGPALYFHTLSQ